MCFYTGRGLSELHAHGSYPIDPNKLKKETDNLNSKAFKCLAKIRELQGDAIADQLTKTFTIGYENFVTNPGCHAYVHDDANLGNFIVNLKEQTLILIDLDRFYYMQTENREPLGFPAEDYHRFINCLEWQSFFDKLPKELIKEAQEHFIAGYQCFNSHITKEAHQYYANYWYLRNLVSRLELDKSA